MKRLSPAQLKNEIAEMTQAADIHRENSNDNWSKWYTTKGCRRSRVEFPLGELTTPAIAGFVWAWNMKGIVQLSKITSSDRFDAQGLEGKAMIDTDYATALLAAHELPEYRRAVYV